MHLRKGQVFLTEDLSLEWSVSNSTCSRELTTIVKHICIVEQQILNYDVGAILTPIALSLAQQLFHHPLVEATSMVHPRLPTGIHRLPSISTVLGEVAHRYPPSSEESIDIPRLPTGIHHLTSISTVRGEVAIGIHRPRRNPSISTVRGGVLMDSSSDGGCQWAILRMVVIDGLLLLGRWIPMDPPCEEEESIGSHHSRRTTTTLERWMLRVYSYSGGGR